jgi:hypothetical protein
MTTRPAAAETSSPGRHVRTFVVFTGILALTLPLLAQEGRGGGHQNPFNK